MAELLIRVVDKVNTDFYFNCRCTKRGDVIVVQEDGWAWGARELDNPDWRIVRIPTLTISEARAYLAEEPETTPDRPSRTRQRRAFRLNLDALPGPVRAWLADGTRQTPILTVDLPLAQVRGLKVARPSIPDPARPAVSGAVF